MAKFIEVDRKEIDEFINALGEFSAKIKQKAVRQIKENGGFWKVTDPKEMIRLRKALLETTRKGMLERKDLEVDIGILAVTIWWNRLEGEKITRMKAEDREGEMEGTEEEESAWEAVRKTGE